MDVKNILLNTLVFDAVGKRSYSQAGEDMIAASFFKHGYKGVYIDVGAYHPKQFSNTYYFYKHGWHGVIVEPNRAMTKLYAISRPRDKVFEMGISDHKGNESYYVFAQATRNTFDEKEAAFYQKEGQQLLSVEKKEVRPLKEILPGEKVDLLSVDAEGSDLMILKSNDWKVCHPRVVIVENEAAGELLKKMDYQLAGKTPYSFIFVHEE